MRQRSNVRHRRNQGQHKAKQRGDHDRYGRTQLARVKTERDHATHALQEAQARLRQRASQRQGLVALPQVDLVVLARPLL